MKPVNKEFKPFINQHIYLIRSRLLKHIVKHAPSLSGRMLDFGCGSKPYRELFKVSEYVGVDYENPGHSHQDEEIDFFYDGHKLPFENDSFDSLFSSEVIEHIFNLPEIIIELHRVLKTGGRMLVTCPFAYCEHEQPNDFARYTSFALKHMLEKTGFRILALEKTGNAIETIFQLKQVYLKQHILYRLRNIPVIRSVARNIIYTGCNLAALICSRIFPDEKNLYLNNVVLAEKI